MYRKAATISASNTVTSRVSGDRVEIDHGAAASMDGSRCMQVARSKSSVCAIDSQTRSTLEMVKLEVKAPSAGRSGLLAAQLKGYAFWLQLS